MQSGLLKTDLQAANINVNQTRVYLLDDEEEMLDLYYAVTEDMGLEVSGFSNATQFFKQVNVFDGDALMVLDLHMPEMDGVEVMRQLAQMRNPPALILISGHDTSVLASAERLGRAHNLEIIASLRKPLVLDEFRGYIERRIFGNETAHECSTGSIDYYFSNNELYHAIHNDQLRLHYQPQFDMECGRITGVEVLVRWQHPDQGMIYPDRFIHRVEKNGWIDDLTNWVIDRATRQNHVWKKTGYDLSMSVNISAGNITSLALPERLAEMLQDDEHNLSQLTLEVTESALMAELVTSLDILTRLRLKGIGLSIDDFGTGYSSLVQLHRVPFTELKIDRSFVTAMIKDDEARAIVKTCITLGHELKMRVVAEGVETKAHFVQLKELGCDIGQGYYYSKPMPAAEMTNFIKTYG